MAGAAECSSAEHSATVGELQLHWSFDGWHRG